MNEPSPAVFRSSDGLDLAADRYGQPRRGSVLMAHGGGQTRHAWAKTAAALADRGWEVVTLDLRGHGDSGWSPTGDYGIERFAGDLAEVARAMGGRPALIGASLGGLAGLYAEAEIAPGGFSSITLVDIVPSMDPNGAAKVMEFMSAHVAQGFGSLEEAAEVIAAYLPHRPRPADLSGLAKNLRQGDDGRLRWHWDPGFVSGVHRGRSLRDADAFQARLPALTLPVHLIRGRLSELVSREAAETFVAQLPNARFTDVAGASHMVAGDRNDAFLTAAVGFLEELDRQTQVNDG
ncbi:MAG: peroxidase [Phenylobacterium sp. RIFCSPHIGHO2_01_FULL_69_31]|uniref:alpha/beta fold hydrolase n=1 Tax=unclassified Phenylobacterium TaxID=2640670 RepID=UPI0008D11BCE|nr:MULTISPECIES: alpha/beta hydrolase [unclassified Phenylobacterium]OHB31154.1 MAG: peroxidase [Phenylobacterium sp. RIFCSPHIGHO2_01_FULL_69_31]TAJ73743.1 MAG: alpha/beta hydrolase [Phenylobacterium sp.]